jgi:hypothetical protein
VDAFKDGQKLVMKINRQHLGHYRRL